MSATRDVIAAEFEQAAALMTRREMALGDALLGLAGEVHVAVEMLSALAASDAILARQLGPIADLLFAGGRSAVGTHAAVVADINQPEVH